MSERDMQFRIGIFVIMAGLVLTMLIIWFGESPAFFRDRVYVIARFVEAPGVAEGIPVRRSGIRIGEVAAVDFERRPHMPDGVLVTLALDRKFPLRDGSVPRITRALIGDVAIDMMPSTSEQPMPVSRTPANAPIIEGEVAPDPAQALAAATEAFERVGGTLQSIDDAARGVSDLARKAENLDETMLAVRDAGRRITTLAEDINRLVNDHESDVGPTLVQFRQFVERANTTFDDEMQANLKATIDRLSTASARLDSGLSSIQPLLNDLGAGTDVLPTTNFGQTVFRINRIASHVGLLTRELTDERGQLNRNGSLQRLVTQPELFENLNTMAIAASNFFRGGNAVMTSLKTFADRIARDPSSLTRGALQR